MTMPSVCLLMMAWNSIMPVIFAQRRKVVNIVFHFSLALFLERRMVSEMTAKSCLFGRGLSRRTHGHSVDYHESPTYKSWSHMLWRCTNPKSDRFRYYGERGIRVCRRWMKFRNFLADMGVRPQGKTLERENNSEGYDPKNCRWASRLEQAHNKRNNVILTFAGITACFSELCRRFGVPESRTRWRLKRGWTLERAFLIPCRFDS
jgi:hypothetical protein